MGLEPGVAGFKAQSNPLSYGGRPPYWTLFVLVVVQGGSGASVCQCRSAVISTTKPVPMQVDGEPCLMTPCRIEIKLDQRNTEPAKMLVRNKTAACEYF